MYHGKYQIMFTGVSGVGKTTIAKEIAELFHIWVIFRFSTRNKRYATC